MNKTSKAVHTKGTAFFLAKQLPFWLLFAALLSEGNLWAQKTTSPRIQPKLKAAGQTTKNSIGTKRILALRVQFLKETPDRGATTGDGHFDLGSNSSMRVIDPPPHNKAYFEDQLLAMRNYFYDVSDGRLDVQYTVKPDGDTAAYTLSKFMEYYGIRGTQAARDKRLAEFFYDAVALADTQDGLDFSQYDHVVIFHAGSGEDFASDNSTTNDLGSRFLSLDLLRSRFGSSFSGIPVQNGLHVVTSGVVVPETETQAFIDPILGTENIKELGLTGILSANYGSQLGMPDLFNTSNGSPGIGVFGLEDFGAVNGDGLIPAEPDPWTKIYLGWAEPVVVTDSGQVSLLPRKMAGQNTILRVPINANEYFLIENKQRNVVDNALSSEVIARFDTINLSDGSTIVDTAYLAGVDRSTATGVITRVDEYDSALPGRGILIWHIDENRIAQNLPFNTVNANLDRRGVRLVEGSGSQDIGRAFFGFFGASIGSGDAFDYFFRGNEAFKFYNKDVDSVFFTSNSVPPSLSNERANTGIQITEISAPSDIMSFTIRTTLLKEGFPQFMGVSPVMNALKIGDLTGDGKPEIVSLSSNGEVFAWQYDGNKVFSNTVTRSRHGLGLDSTVYNVALLAVTGELTQVTPALADLNNDGKMEIICGGISGRLSVWEVVDADLNGLADTLFTFQTPDIISCSPMVLPDKKILVGSSDGTLSMVNPNGTLFGSINLGARITSLAVLSSDSIVAQTPTSVKVVRISTLQSSTILNAPMSSNSVTVADLDQDGVNDVVSIGENGVPSLFSNGVVLPVSLPFSIYGDQAIADLDRDGFLEVIAGGDNQVVAMNHNGSSVTNFPAILDPSSPRGRVISAVVVGDVSGDGQADVVAGTQDGLVYAFDGSGRPVAGFPLTVGSTVLGLVLADLDGDGSVELGVTATDQFLYVFALNVPYVSASMKWPQSRHDASNTASSNELNIITPVLGDVIPARRAYNYPNPARGNQTTIRYFLTETANVKIYIYDLAGDLVEKLEGPGVGQTDNEVNWNLKKIESGVYIAQIIAKGQSGKRSTRTVKIAVIK